LLEALEAGHTDERTRKRKDWPATPRGLSGALRRVAPSLRRVGLSVTFGKHTRAGTPVALTQSSPVTERTCKPPSPPSPPSPAKQDKDLPRDGQEGGGDEGVPSPSLPNPLPRQA